MLRAKLLPIPTADSFFDGTFLGVAGLGDRGLPSLPALTGGGVHVGGLGLRGAETRAWFSIQAGVSGG